MPLQRLMSNCMIYDTLLKKMDFFHLKNVPTIMLPPSRTLGLKFKKISKNFKNFFLLQKNLQNGPKNSKDAKNKFPAQKAFDFILHFWPNVSTPSRAVPCGPN